MAVKIISRRDYPPIDLARFKTATTSEKQAMANELRERLDTYGFMIFSNHGVPLQDLDKTYEILKKLFALSTETKAKYRAPRAGLNGYFEHFFETAVTSQHADLKEFWHVLKPAQDSSGRDIYPPNPWPDEVPEFRPTIEGLLYQLDLCAQNIMEMISVLMGVENVFREMCINGCSTLRLIHYPPVRGAIHPGQIRAGTHTGIQLIGLQPKTTHPGLEFLTHQGEWVKLEGFDDCLSVNVGDMLQAITRSQLRATPHRVVNPQEQEANESRYAAVYFYHANPEVMIQPLESVKSREGAPSFAPIRAGDWLAQRIAQISKSSTAEAD